MCFITVCFGLQCTYGGYGSHCASNARMTRPSHKRELQAASLDEDLEHILKPTRLAEARTNAVKAEIDTDKAEQLPTH
jgi:hypothetical protein